MKAADCRHRKNVDFLNEQKEITTKDLNNLVKRELSIFNSFEKFSQVFQKVKSRPQFSKYNIEGVNIPKCKLDDIDVISMEASMLLKEIGKGTVIATGVFS